MDGAAAVEIAWVRQRIASGDAQTIREAAHLSQSEVSRAIGVTRGAVALWEQRRRNPQGEVALRYAALLRSLAKLSATDPQ